MASQIPNAKFYFKVTFYYYLLWKPTIWRKANWECMFTCINFCQNLRRLKEVIKNRFSHLLGSLFESFSRETKMRASAHRNSEGTDYGIQKTLLIPQKWLSECKLLILLGPVVQSPIRLILDKRKFCWAKILGYKAHPNFSTNLPPEDRFFLKKPCAL